MVQVENIEPKDYGSLFWAKHEQISVRSKIDFLISTNTVFVKKHYSI